MEDIRALRRQKVMVGDLPEDFLRISHSPDEGKNEFKLDGSFHLLNNTTFPSETIGNLAVTVVEAELTKSYGLTKMDPYVRLKIGQSVYETHANLRGGKHPQWNKMFQSYLLKGIRTIFIEVFDERAIVPDERIAWLNLNLPEELFEKQYVENWYPLSGRQGEGKEGKIKLILVFIPVQAQSYHVPHASAPLMVVPTQFYSGLPYYSSAHPIPVSYTSGHHQWPVNPYSHVQQSQQPVPLSDEDVKQLQEMFPAFDKDIVVNVLRSSQGNKDKAINSLLSMSADE